ncbi:hypothetical protein ACFQOZ_18795 [Comamonas endophytica]|uniref:hypothetical protein n=1 Tax=Comamonas endophytica TaxID=2949090 RepID=UPI0036160AC5
MKQRPFVSASSVLVSAIAALLAGCAASGNYDMPAAGTPAPVSTTAPWAAPRHRRRWPRPRCPRPVWR